MRALLWAVVGGCSSAEAVLQTETEGGSWTVSLGHSPQGPGLVSMPVGVEPADGALVAFVASMPNMGHASDGSIEDRGGGEFLVEVDITMSGWWVIDGEVQGEPGTEAFRLELEVP